jgi:hypothetical protein
LPSLLDIESLGVFKLTPNLLALATTLAILGWLPILCPSCRSPLTREQWKQGTCPCGGPQQREPLLSAPSEDEADTTCSRCGITLLTSQHLVPGPSGPVCFRCAHSADPRHEAA